MRDIISFEISKNGYQYGLKKTNQFFLDRVWKRSQDRAQWIMTSIRYREAHKHSWGPPVCQALVLLTESYSTPSALARYPLL